jgi:putative endonuclease
MWYTYILKSPKDGQFYVGSTNDLKRRLKEHKNGLCKSTRHRMPVNLEAYIAVQNESVARSLEKYLKSGSGIATLRKRILASEVRSPKDVGGPTPSAIPRQGFGWQAIPAPWLRSSRPVISAIRWRVLLPDGNSRTMEP